MAKTPTASLTESASAKPSELKDLREPSGAAKPAGPKKPKEIDADAISGAAAASLGETTKQFPTRAARPDLESERSRQESVATLKDPTTPAKSTQTTPAIPLVASIPAITASGEPAVWTRKRLIIVAAVGIALVLLLGIARQLTTPHSFRNAADRPNAEEITNYDEAQKTQVKTDEKRKIKFVRFGLTDEQKKLTGKARIDVLQRLSDKATDFLQALLVKGATFDQVVAKLC
jgi:hypothetical protein